MLASQPQCAAAMPESPPTCRAGEVPVCALRAGSCAYINPSSALAGPACRGEANPADCARFQALSNAQDQACFPHRCLRCCSWGL